MSDQPPKPIKFLILLGAILVIAFVLGVMCSGCSGPQLSLGTETQPLSGTP